MPCVERGINGWCKGPTFMLWAADRCSADEYQYSSLTKPSDPFLIIDNREEMRRSALQERGSEIYDRMLRAEPMPEAEANSGLLAPPLMRR